MQNGTSTPRLMTSMSTCATSEAALLGLAVLGGSIGAWLGMQVWHHKTQHKKLGSHIEKSSHIGCWGFIVLCVIVELLFNLFGVHEGILIWLNEVKLPQLIVLAIVSAIVIGYFKYIMKLGINKIATEMAEVFLENNNKGAMYLWWLRVREIVGDWWYRILWS